MGISNETENQFSVCVLCMYGCASVCVCLFVFYLRIRVPLPLPLACVSVSVHVFLCFGRWVFVVVFLFKVLLLHIKNPCSIRTHTLAYIHAYMWMYHRQHIVSIRWLFLLYRWCIINVNVRSKSKNIHNGTFGSVRKTRAKLSQQFSLIRLANFEEVRRRQRRRWRRQRTNAFTNTTYSHCMSFFFKKKSKSLSIRLTIKCDWIM